MEANEEVEGVIALGVATGTRIARAGGNQSDWDKQRTTTSGTKALRDERNKEQYEGWEEESRRNERQKRK